MSLTFETLREFEDKRVRMRFDDGLEAVGVLLNVSQNFDGSLHLIYDLLETATFASSSAKGSPTGYANGHSLLGIQLIS